MLNPLIYKPEVINALKEDFYLMGYVFLNKPDGLYHTRGFILVYHHPNFTFNWHGLIIFLLNGLQSYKVLTKRSSTQDTAPELPETPASGLKALDVCPS